MRHDFNDFSFSPQLPLPDLLVWDMDGTLTQSKLTRHVASDQESNARRFLMAADRCYKAARSIKDMITPNFHLRDDIKASILGLVSKRQDVLTDSLSFVSAFNMRQAVISNNSRSAMGDKVLNHYKIKEHIEHSLFNEDMRGFKKPDPEVMAILLEEIGIEDGATIWVMGDSASDMKFALNSDQALPHQVIPIATGLDSRAAAFLNTEEHIGHHAIISEPLDVSLLCSLDRQVLGWEAKMNAFGYEDCDIETHIRIDPEI